MTALPQSTKKLGQNDPSIIKKHSQKCYAFFAVLMHFVHALTLTGLPSTSITVC